MNDIDIIGFGGCGVNILNHIYKNGITSNVKVDDTQGESILYYEIPEHKYG